MHILLLRSLSYMYIDVTPFCCVSNYAIVQDMLHYLRKEFKSSEVIPAGTSGVRPISWYGLRYMITEVS